MKTGATGLAMRPIVTYPTLTVTEW
jgi:hypothetical protein